MKRRNLTIDTALFISITITDHVILHLIRSKDAEQRKNSTTQSEQDDDDYNDGTL